MLQTSRIQVQRLNLMRQKMVLIPLLQSRPSIIPLNYHITMTRHEVTYLALHIRVRYCGLRPQPQVRRQGGKYEGPQVTETIPQ
jgi:hypothetical protein